MKKSVLLLLSAVMTAASAFAQVAKPTVEAIKITEATPSPASLDTAAVNSEDAPIYLYNQEAGLFLRGGADWGTRATLSTNANLSDIYDFKVEDFAGYKWTVAKVPEKDRKDGTKPQYWSIANKTTSNYLTADNRDGIWVDGGKDRPWNGWYIEDIQNDNSFKLGYIAISVKDGDTTYVDWGHYGAQYMGTTGELRTFLLGDTVSTANTRWIFVSQATHDAVVPKIKQYWAYKSYEKGLSDFKAVCDSLNLNIDWTDYNAYLTGEYQYADYKALYDEFSLKLKLGSAIGEAKKLDAARDWSYFEAIFADSISASALNGATDQVNALIALKKAIDEGAALDAAHDYSAFLAIYTNDASKVADINAATANVNAFVSLKKKLNEAAGYPIDVTAQTTVYNNSASTAAQLAAAEKAVQDMITEQNILNATLDNPAEVTDKIGYMDPAAIVVSWGQAPIGWSREYTGSLQNGVFHINNWSTEGNSDGSEMVNPYIELWQGGGTTLYNQRIYRDASKQPFTLPAGAYKITAHMRITHESGANKGDLSGAYIFGNNLLTSLTGEDGAALPGATYNDKNYYSKEFTGYGIVTKDGKLKFGVETIDAKFTWVISKDWHIWYLGAGSDAFNFVRQNSELTGTISDDAIGTKDLINTVLGYQNNYFTSTNTDDIYEAYTKIAELSDSVTKNIAAYQSYQDSLTYAQQLVEEKKWQGAAADLLVAYLTGTKGPDANFPNGGAKYVLAERTLTTEEIQEENHFLNELLDVAKKTSIAEGDDVTYLLVNPKFGEGTKNPNTGGWVGSQGLGGFKDAAGNATYVVAEQYMGTVNFYQVVKGAPAGIYKIETQAFVRPGANDHSDEWSEDVINTYLYMNQFRTKVPSIMKDGQPVATAIDHVNCYLSDSTGWFGVVSLADYNYNDKYVPNCHPGAATHFIAGHYNTYTYGLVADGEDMKIGVTSDGKGPAINDSGNTIDGSWFLFSGFKLTFMGKNLEAIKEVLAVKYNELKQLADEHKNDLTFDLLDNDITPLLEKSSPEATAAVTDADELYELLMDVNAMVQTAQQDLADRTEGKKAYDAMVDAVDTLATYAAEYATLESYSNYLDLKDQWTNSQEELVFYYDDDDNEITVHDQYVALIDSMKACTEELAADALAAKAASASDDNPQDMTSLIVNPDMEDHPNDQQTGWTFWIAMGNGPVKSSGGITGASLEAWSGLNNGRGKDLDFYAYQKLGALPEGTYEVSAAACNAGNDVAEDENAWTAGTASEGRVYFYAIVRDSEGNEKSFASKAVKTSVGSATEAGRDTLVFTVAEGDTVEIGHKTVGEVPFRWFMCDDYKLFFYGANSAKEASADEGQLVGIDEKAIQQKKKAVAIYNAAGARVANLQKGINIVKYADGKVQKIFVK